MSELPAVVLPKPIDSGSFEPVLGRAPATWPWALPHLYAVNAASEVRRQIVAAFAAPSGEYADRSVLRSKSGRVEVIGYWGKSYRIVHTQEFPTFAEARRSAEETFEQLPVRFLLEDGFVREENTAVEVTGEWPRTWAFKRASDIGAFCAYIYQQVLNKGHLEVADSFKGSLYFAWPPTEQLMVYLRALECARLSLRDCVSPSDMKVLQAAMKNLKQWLAR